MSQINQIGGNAPIQPVVVPPTASTSAATSSTPVRASDRLELSGASHLLKALKTNDIRTEKVAAIRAQIDAGTYEDDAKLDSAADKLQYDLNK